MIIPSRGAVGTVISAYCEVICQRNVMFESYAKERGKIVTTAFSRMLFAGLVGICSLHYPLQIAQDCGIQRSDGIYGQD